MPRTAEEFGFSYEVKGKAHLRQNGVCAMCGVSIAWATAEAHPVYPVTESSTATSGWRKELDNCVLLCTGCYEWTHLEGSNPSGSPTLPDEFKFSHGKPKGGGRHDEWRVRMMGR